MLKVSQEPEFFESLRAAEFARLDGNDQAYLDYTGAALYGASQVKIYAERLAGGIFGNPHSEHGPSRASLEALDIARRRTLAFFGVDESSHAAVFTANTSAAVRLVAESYPFSGRRGLVLSADNHNSVNGVREYARRADASIAVLPLDAGLRMQDPEPRLSELARQGAGLLAFPAQSNFSGVQHDLSLASAAKRLGFDVLIDIAAFVPTKALDLKTCPADFVALSFYKLFGLPTGLGALILRREALAKLKRPWFAGGTVDFVSVQHDLHRLRRGHEGFEDGTPNFLAGAALGAGFDILERVGMGRLTRRVTELTGYFLRRAHSLTYPDGAPLVRVYGPQSAVGRGGTVAFNVLRPDGGVVRYEIVERRAARDGVAMRGGCFCNPGTAEQAFGFAPADTARCFAALAAQFSVPKFAACLGGDTAVGAVRASFGLPTNFRDVDRAIAVIASFAECPTPAASSAEPRAREFLWDAE
jgi:selenocysteine lyase/cysteine desulfurase